MNLQVHGQMTREWAREEGFTDEEVRTIARYNVAVDAVFPGPLPRNKHFHHIVWGGPATRDAYFARAVRERSLAHLGVALHVEQDMIGHGWIGSFVHWPMIDRFERRSARVRERLEQRTRELLRAYREHAELGRYAGALTVDIPDTPLPEGSRRA